VDAVERDVARSIFESGMTLEESYAHCRHVAKTRAKNFYYSFVLLQADQKNAMCAMYAFMRYCDDLSDEAGATAASIEQWRAALTEALAGRPGQHPMWLGFLDSVQRFKIPHQYFYDMIDGVLSDIEPRRIATFAELYRYCYQVASVVGLTTIHIFGFDDPRALELAEKCGIAFQLTNILRDVREDDGLGRRYLPAEDLERFGVTALDQPTGNFRRLMEFEAERARTYYRESAPLLQLVHKRSRGSLWALIAIYSRLLDRIRKENYDVLRRRISLSKAQKSWIILQALVRG
jgi:phytoene synthase